MIGALLSLALMPAAVPALGVIGRQQLPARGCAAYLWRTDRPAGSTALAAMVEADAATLRLSVDGATLDLPQAARTGDASLGFATDASYRGSGLTATLTLGVVPRPDLRDGAGVPQATLRLARDGGDELVVPLAGLIGCRPA